jgi:hypothetical protein
MKQHRHSSWQGLAKQRQVKAAAREQAVQMVLQVLPHCGQIHLHCNALGLELRCRPDP